MRMFIEYFVLFLFMLCFLWVGSTFVYQNMYFNNAREYKESVVAQLENSDYAPSVMYTCFQKAKYDGYTLTYTTASVSDEKQTYKVDLKFDYTIPLINYKKEYHVTGYTG